MLFKRYAMQAGLVTYNDAPVVNLICLECTDKNSLHLLVCRFKVMSMNDLIAAVQRHEETSHIDKSAPTLAVVR